MSEADDPNGSNGPKGLSTGDLMRHTAVIVAGYVSGHEVARDDLPGLIKDVHDALCELSGGKGALAPAGKPAVPIEDSVTPDHIVCLEDGKKLKMLKRYLRTHFDLSPEEYRERWGLPKDYPMVAPNYAAKRSEVARNMGLGETPDKRGKRGPKKAK